MFQVSLIRNIGLSQRKNWELGVQKYDLLYVNVNPVRMNIDNLSANVADFIHNSIITEANLDYPSHS